MDRLIPTLLTVGVVIVLFALMWWGWNRKRAQQAARFPVPARPAAGTAVLAGPVPGMYVATTLADQPLERVQAHHLGVRTDAELSIAADGIILDRAGTDDLLIPRAAITGVRTASGMIGKFVERDGLVVITWTLGEVAVDTGFRTRAAADRTHVIESIRQLIGESS
ncbi:hypothetical protein [Brevibacterium samyangense]|uniref:PH domain-containing protein n=1 Tax=Brevibacterium samyangense TaxID=366888 RepID=A0ABP5EXF1_9MICO